MPTASAATTLRKSCPTIGPLLLLGIAAACPLSADEPYQLQPGIFPPPGTARYISGELIASDPLNRTGVLRPDRTDAQRRGDWDRPLPFVMLAYGSLQYHAAPAELRHIPLGTHVHGWFYRSETLTESLPEDDYYRRLSIDAHFNRALLLQDDFSYDQALGRKWQVQHVDRDNATLTVTSSRVEDVAAKPIQLQLPLTARVWKKHGWATLDDLAAGQDVLINLTYCTLKGPGRCVDIWLDADASQRASQHQREVHRQYCREHGLAGIVEAVDNSQRIVTVALFDGFDPGLLDEFPAQAELSSPQLQSLSASGEINPQTELTAAVAEENLRTWDQINDRKRGPLLEIQRTPPQPGFAGVRLRFQPSVLLEGFRPQRIIRVWPNAWKVDDLPREERLYQ